MKRPASLAFLHDEGQRRAPPSSSATPFSKVESEGGHPRGCPSVSPTGDEDVDVPAGKAQRKSRWAAHVPSVTTLPPQGVDRTSDFLQPYQSDGANKRDATRTSCLPPAAPPVSSTAARPKLQGPLAVKSKAGSQTCQCTEPSNRRARAGKRHPIPFAGTWSGRQEFG